MEHVYGWQWPRVGPTPVNYGMDSEIFDSEKFRYSQTLVREAIQNSLDARLPNSAPVRVRFDFHKTSLGKRGQFLSDLVGKKADCGLQWPAEWDNGEVTWLTIEDQNTRGLEGDLGKRTGDFWNYWLNFGLSNKDGSGRGGRGIGRITFLIASRINTVIGLTRRRNDGKLAACGMSLLKPIETNDEFKSSYAYLASAPLASTFALYDSSEFHLSLATAFETETYADPTSSGLSLIIPYPHPDLSAGHIKAASIEHFAPAIIGKSLVVEVDGEVLDEHTIDNVAKTCSGYFSAQALRENSSAVLALVKAITSKPDFTFVVSDLSKRLGETIDPEAQRKVREHFESRDGVKLIVEIPVVRDGVVSLSPIVATLSHAPQGRRPSDFFFREGMCLPEVTARNVADINLIVQSNSGELATYLNFCEGKAHLGLLENSEVKAKLVQAKFSGSFAEKRFVRRLMDDLRSLVLPDAEEPDATAFAQFFSAPTNDAEKVNKKKKKRKDVVVVVPPSPPRTPTLVVESLADGFRIRANPKFDRWPVNVRVEYAYADGSRKPAWSRYDFLPKDLNIGVGGALNHLAKDNLLTCRGCDATFNVEVSGFDIRREVVTNIRVFRDA